MEDQSRRGRLHASRRSVRTGPSSRRRPGRRRRTTAPPFTRGRVPLRPTVHDGGGRFNLGIAASHRPVRTHENDHRAEVHGGGSRSGAGGARRRGRAGAAGRAEAAAAAGGAVVHGGEARSADPLIDAVWGPSPPASAESSCRSTFRSCARHSPRSGSTRGSGYALELEQESLDAARFERLLAESRAASREGNAALAASLLRRALGLWRGGPTATSPTRTSRGRRPSAWRSCAWSPSRSGSRRSSSSAATPTCCRSCGASPPLTRCGSACTRRRCWRCTAAGGRRRLSSSTRLPAPAARRARARAGRRAARAAAADPPARP